jgi:HAD superfamily hydrolase (TIGR01484 family)
MSSANHAGPLALASLADARCARVDKLYFDVDDTVTWRGELPEVAARALYKAKDAGLSLVAVTGRSASWGELLLRLFPLDAVIAETGALCMHLVDDAQTPEGRRVAVMHSEPDDGVRRENARRRQAAADEVLATVPSARLALDNMGRVYDTAFDLVEDGPAVDETAQKEIWHILEKHGLRIAQSSVHINAWFGRFDKATMVARYLEEVCKTSFENEIDTLMYAGDSKNDGEMFAAVSLSVGVANIAPHLSALTARGQAPAYLTDKDGGHGFAELVDRLVDARTNAEPS